MYKRVKEQVHFVGIGGIGMSGIAEVLARQGFPVSGSDLADSDTVQALRKLGVRIAIGHRSENIAGAKVVVVSTAVPKENPEVQAAARRGITIVSRGEMLAELMRPRFGIAVAGTHGKTSTTSLLASIVREAKLDPTVIVGGKVDALGGNACLGSGQFLIAEADESDGSFLKLSPVLTIITNIDNDHLDHYGGMEKLRLAFLEFANKVPYYGRTIVCVDNPENRKLLPLIIRPKWTYGFSEDADFVIRDFKASGTGSSFSLFREGVLLAQVSLGIPGSHNALNATAALVAALEMDVELSAALKALAAFRGVRRRFELKGTLAGGAISIVDDYGHHPAEMAATIAAARGCGYQRVVVAFQPHRFTRTRLCWDQFGPALSGADLTYLLDIYSAGEAPIPGITSERLAEAIGKTHPCVYVGGMDTAAETLRRELKSGDLLITLGAGSITQLGPRLLEKT